jgi:hypothetical protein
MKKFIGIMTSHLTAFFLGLSITQTLQAQNCNQVCMLRIAEQYLNDVQKQDSSTLPWAEVVRYTENNVAMMIGDGFWGAGPSVEEGGLLLADTQTDNVVWLGVTREHGQAAYHGLRLHISEGRIDEVESYLGREGEPDLFASIDNYKLNSIFSSEVPLTQRSSRVMMQSIVQRWFEDHVLNAGEVSSRLAAGCEHIINGVNTTKDESYWMSALASDCASQLSLGLHRPVERIRGLRFPVIDPERGLVVALSLQDRAVRTLEYKTTQGDSFHEEVPYPNTRGRFEIFKVVNGEILRVESVSVFLPYYIHNLWE